MISTAHTRKLLRRQKLGDGLFQVVAVVGVVIALATLGALIADALVDGVPRIDWKFLTSFPSRKPAEAGIFSALVGSVYLITLTAVVAVPIGIAAAVYLEEYTNQSSRLSRIIEVNVANLAGVPSIIYGLLGLELFVRAMRLERSLLAGALTLALLVLPIVIIASREAIRAVPSTIREAAYALGATQWQTTKHHVLPLAFPGILTGIILSVSRAIGETAPLITIGAAGFVGFIPYGLLSPFTALPIQIFSWVSDSKKEFHINAAAGIVILLVVTLLLNALAIFLRNRYQKQYQ